jgi:hypothetical protein
MTRKKSTLAVAKRRVVRLSRRDLDAVLRRPGAPVLGQVGEALLLGELGRRKGESLGISLDAGWGSEGRRVGGGEGLEAGRGVRRRGRRRGADGLGVRD